MADVGKPREEWDFEAFVRLYNAFARKFGGWNFDPMGRPEEKLRGYYALRVYESLSDFARTQYEIDQQV